MPSEKEAKSCPQEWVAGFLFKDADERVLVIRKTHPEWQKGKLNGIGGKLENGETPVQAMRREFSEEAGIFVNGWREFCTLNWKGGTVHFMRATWNADMKEPRSMTDELVMWKASMICEWPGDSFIPNLRWLVPMARDKDSVFAIVNEPDSWNGSLPRFTQSDIDAAYERGRKDGGK